MNVTGPHSGFAGAGFAGATSTGARQATTSAPTPFSGHAHPAASKGSQSPFGLITGLLTCCALVPFSLGVLVMGGFGLAARRTLSKAANFKIPNLTA